MAKAKRRASARKRSRFKRGRGTKRPTAAHKKAAKRTARKTAAKKVAKRTPRKKVAVPKEPPTQAAAITKETVVDIVEEPAPGVVVVTELQEMQIITPENEECSD